MKQLPTCNASQLAALLGVTSGTVSRWIDAGMPCKRGRTKGHAVAINLHEALPWLLARRSRPGSHQERLVAERADRLAIDNEARRGQLILTPQGFDVLSRLQAALERRHETIPDEEVAAIARSTSPGEIRALLLDEMRRQRTGIASDLAAIEAERPDAV